MFDKLIGKQILKREDTFGKTIVKMVNNRRTGVIFFSDGTFYIVTNGCGSPNCFENRKPLNHFLERDRAYDVLTDMLFLYIAEDNDYYPIISECGYEFFKRGYVSLGSLWDYYLKMRLKNQKSPEFLLKIKEMIQDSITIKDCEKNCLKQKITISIK